MSLDPALCADGCGNPAVRERLSYEEDDFGIRVVTELVCEPHATQEATG